jgi:hypothetical protein
MRHPVLLTIGLLSLTAARPSMAQEIPCAAGPCVKPPQPGTHFIAEINGGGSFTGNVGPAVGGVLGVGGKLRGFPLRFYLIGELSWASVSSEGTLPSGSLAFREERSYRDLALGLRIYVPVYGPLRLFVDAMGGGSHAAALMEREGLSTLSTNDWNAVGLLASGVQVRLFHHLSIGLRARVVLGGDNLEGLRQLVGTDTPTRTSMTAGLTWHF